MAALKDDCGSTMSTENKNVSALWFWLKLVFPQLLIGITISTTPNSENFFFDFTKMYFHADRTTAVKHTI